ncbi:MAG: glycerophosphodiester phosphodiesterase, partial [Acidobacteria bacterium]|nr:glycerophosphodiester phosphodiesterase [Acidobacteriota bacterium]
KEIAESGPPIPVLGEVLEAFGGTVEYELELKGFTLDFLAAVVQLVRQYGLLEQVECPSSHAALLWHLRQREPEARIGRFVTPWPAWMPAALGQRLLVADLTLSQVNVAHCPLALLLPAVVERRQAAGQQIAAADCNTREELEQAFTLGVDRLSTDQVGLAVDLRRALWQEGLGA